MTQFGSPSAPGRTYRERAYPTRPLLPTGIDVNLQTPGLAFEPPVSAGAQMADDLAKSLGMLGDTIAMKARLEAIERAKQEREDEKLKTVDEGHANETFDRWAPGVLAQIAERKIVPAGDDAAIQQQATEAAEREVPADASPAYRDQWRRRAVPFYVKALTTSGMQLKAEATDSLLGTGSAAITAEMTDEQVQEKLGSVRALAPGMSDAEFYGKTLVPAMNRAANTGNVEATGRLAGLLPAEFATEKQTATTEAAQRSSQRQSKLEAEASDATAADIDRAYLGQGTYQQAIEKIDRMPVSDDYKARLRANVVQAQEQAGKRALSVVVDTQVNNWRESVWRGAEDTFMSGRSFLIDEAEFTDAAGNRHSISRDDQLKDAFDRSVRRIADRKLTPVQTQDEIIKLATANDYGPPPWKRLLGNGYAAATDATLTGDQIPETTSGGFTLYRNLKAKSPTVLSKLVDKPTEDFYETALAVQEDQSIGSGTPDSDRQALLAARRITAERGFINDASAKELNEAAAKMGVAWGPIPNTVYKNSGEISGMIARMSRLYVRSGKSAGAAVSRAAEKLKAEIAPVNGWAVRVNQASIPEEVRPQFPKILEGFVKQWTDRHAEEEGREPDDYSVRYNPNSGTWFIVDAQSSGLEVSAYGDPDSISVTTTELLRRFEASEHEKSTKKLEEAKQKVLNPSKADTTSTGDIKIDYARRSARRLLNRLP